MEYSKRDQATFTQSKEKGKTTQENDITDVFAELELTMYTALETYSNVHRGSGHYSMVTTHLFELARDIVLEYLGLNKGQYVVIFCSPLRAEALVKQFEPGSYQVVSSREIGLQLGTRALAVKRKALPRGAPFQAGGGTARLMSREWVVWAGAPDRFEAGTPAIINIIALARALQMIKRSGNDLFLHKAGEPSGMDLCPDPAAVKKAVTRILYHDDLEKYTGREPLDELRRTLIGRDVLVPTMEGRRSFINLDNSASTPTFTPVWNTFQLAWRQPAEVQQEIIHNVKSICAEVLGAPQSAYEVIFTSNTTEAINLAAGSLGRESGEDTAPVVLNTLPEHS